MPPVEEGAWLVVDHELLSRLGPDTPAADWQRALKRTGLWELDGLEGVEGRDLAEVRAAVAIGLVSGRDPVSDAPILPAAWARAGWAAPAGAVAVCVIVGVYLGGAPFWAGVGLAALVATGMRAWHGSPPAAALPGPLAWPSDRATRALRRFLSHTFVAPAGGRIVENTPHRAWLELRLEEIGRALRATDARIDELRQVRERIGKANTRLGRPFEDVETARLAASIQEQEATRARVEGVRVLLAERLADLERQLDRLRTVVERQALSERVSRLTAAGGAQDPTERVAAEVEIDVAEIEGRVKELALETGDADARLRAVLEVVSADRR